jgi:hypothetical protein
MVLFLDIDGVLHPFPLAIDDEQFSAIDRLWVLLERLPTVHVVITSTWRERHSFDELVQMLTKHGGVKFKERFVGITPVLEPPNEYVPGIRQREIEAWLHANDRANKPYIILDDIESYFDADCARLYLVDGTTGLTNQDVEAVAGHLGNWIGEG